MRNYTSTQCGCLSVVGVVAYSLLRCTLSHYRRLNQIYVCASATQQDLIYSVFIAHHTRMPCWPLSSAAALLWRLATLVRAASYPLTYLCVNYPIS